MAIIAADSICKASQIVKLLTTMDGHLNVCGLSTPHGERLHHNGCHASHGAGNMKVMKLFGDLRVTSHSSVN
jgi:hypothetical protein